MRLGQLGGVLLIAAGLGAASSGCGDEGPADGTGTGGSSLVLALPSIPRTLRLLPNLFPYSVWFDARDLFFEERAPEGATIQGVQAATLSLGGLRGEDTLRVWNVRDVFSCHGQFLWPTLQRLGVTTADLDTATTVAIDPERPPRRGSGPELPNPALSSARLRAEPGVQSRASRANGSVQPPSRAEGMTGRHSTLAGESRCIDEARCALEEDPCRALALTREHRRRFPSGQLESTRELIAIAALQRLGAPAAAKRRAEAALAADPNGIHAKRLASWADGE
ncbi:MAG: hypothetical protein JW751_02835 [Polyangiaceae bacterium]|nr:hypothetical protein [Polyangiaceae bacterium]